jgi:endonuclease III
MNQVIRKAIFSQLAKDIPNPTTELQYQSNFELLIAVILSAQATDQSVNQGTIKLFSVANTPESLFSLGENGLKPFIKHIGLYNTKAKNIIKTCRLLIDQHSSQVPNKRIFLEKLPGVGRKTANVILNTVFGHAVIAVDTHIFRIANRTGLAKGKDVREVEDKLTRFCPTEFKQDAHHLLILHGRYVCTARKPRCTSCNIHTWCEYSEKTI